MEGILIFIRKKNGDFAPVLRYKGDSRKLAKLLIKFRRARKAIKKSSVSITGSDYQIGSLRWMACHSGYIYDSRRKIKIYFTNPYLRKILHYVD